MNYSFKKLFSHRKNKTFTLKKEINPDRDWGRLLLIFVIVSAVALSVSLYVLYQMNNGTFFREKNVLPPLKTGISKEELTDTIIHFTQKEQHLGELQSTTTSSIPNPSE